jgi:cell division protein ZapA
MPLVNIMVNNRAYTIACDEGEEEHLRELAAHVDSKVRELLSSVGQVGEQRLLLMAALLLADERHDASSRLVARTKEVTDLAGSHEEIAAKLDQSETFAAELLENAAKDLEDVAARLAHA